MLMLLLYGGIAMIVCTYRAAFYDRLNGGLAGGV